MSRISAAVSRIQRWDETLCVRMHGALRHLWLQLFFRAVSWLGNGIFWYSLMLAMLLSRRAEAVGPIVHMVLVGALCTVVYKLLKRGTLRPRPYQALGGVAAGAGVLDSFSFPSGHTLHAVAFTLVAGSYYPVLAVPLAIFTALTATSRVMLGLHYPSDVLAGAALGGALAASVLALTPV